MQVLKHLKNTYTSRLLEALVLGYFELFLFGGRGNGEGHVDAAEDDIGGGLAVEESLAFVVTLKKKNCVVKSLKNNQLTLQF